MLTKEIIIATAALSGLTDEQIDAITTLSQNDENSVIARKTGEIYGALDTDIFEVSGVAKNGTEKTYDYAKRVLGEMKTKVANIDAMQKQISILTKEKAFLEKAIADGTGDAETAKALKQAKADLANITSQYNDLNDKYQKAQTNHDNELFGIRVENALQTAAAGIKFKAELPESVTGIIMRQAMDKIKCMTPEYIDDGKGGKIIAFKGEDGAILRNPNNQLNPYTPGELLAKELDTMDVIDKGRHGAGGGTRAQLPGKTSGAGIDVSGAKSRVEATDIISKALMAQGMTVGSDDYDRAMTQAWKDNNISALPEQ